MIVVNPFEVLDVLMKTHEAYAMLHELLHLELVKTLQESGDVHVTSALRALNDMQYSHNPTEQIRDAIADFRNAHDFFQRAAEQSKMKGLIMASPKQRAEAFAKACNASLFMALLAQLKNTQEHTKDELPHRYYLRAMEDFNQYASARIEKADRAGKEAALLGSPDIRVEVITGIVGSIVGLFREPPSRARKELDQDRKVLEEIGQQLEA